MKVSFKKKLIFITALFIIVASFLADFCFPETAFHSLQQFLFRWFILSLIVILLVCIEKERIVSKFNGSSLIILFILTVGFILRFYKLDYFGLYFDEALTTLRAIVFLEDKRFIISYAGIPIAFFKGQTQLCSLI